jgi:lipid A 4'-phosphatase
VSPQQRWLAGELGALALAAVLAAWLFELHPIDLQVAHLFYDPRSPSGWPWDHVGWVKFVNERLITILSIAGALGSLALWVLGGRISRSWRFAGMYLLLSLAIGPGVIVNGVLKNEWGRAVPREVVDFGGTHIFRHISNPGPSGAPSRGGEGGSFPSGHTSVAVWTSAFYFLLRRRRPGLGFAALGGSFVFSALVAFARMSAGRHFLSDVVWSGIIVLTVNCLVYHALMLRVQRSVPEAKEALGTATPADAG